MRRSGGRAENNRVVVISISSRILLSNHNLARFRVFSFLFFSAVVKQEMDGCMEQDTTERESYL